MIDLKKSTRIWSVEDVNEYTYYSSHSPHHVIDFINNNDKVKQSDEAYLVCEYESSRAIVPDDVKTVRTFLLQNAIIEGNSLIDIERDND